MGFIVLTLFRTLMKRYGCEGMGVVFPAFFSEKYIGLAGLSPRRTGFAPASINVGFAVDKVALGQVFLRVHRFSPVSIIPPSLFKLI
jgi:hypothetical protein